MDRTAETLPQPETWPRTFPSAKGPDIVLQRPPLSIVTLQPNIAEMLARIGAASHISGVDRYTDYPPNMTRKPQIGDILNPDYEQILSINPDLIITSRGTPAEVFDKLRGFGFQVLGVDPHSLNDVFSCMKTFGRMIGTEDHVDEIVGKMQQRATEIADSARAAAKKAGRPRTVFVLSMDPLFVAGEGSFIASLIADAGGLHVISATTPTGEQMPWLQVSRETIVAAAPEVLVFASRHASQPDPESAERLLARLRDDPAWAGLPAVADGRVYTIDDDLITIPGPRLLLGFDRLIRCLQPAADMEDTPESEAVYRQAKVPPPSRLCPLPLPYGGAEYVVSGPQPLPFLGAGFLGPQGMGGSAGPARSAGQVGTRRGRAASSRVRSFQPESVRANAQRNHNRNLHPTQ